MYQCIITLLWENEEEEKKKNYTFFGENNSFI